MKEILLSQFSCCKRRPSYEPVESSKVFLFAPPERKAAASAAAKKEAEIQHLPRLI
tara:strand:+ start:129 stop:296 length:168 start_codon:yes stop_codon:yes gene_type:complete